MMTRTKITDSSFTIERQIEKDFIQGREHGSLEFGEVSLHTVGGGGSWGPHHIKHSTVEPNRPNTSLTGRSPTILIGVSNQYAGWSALVYPLNWCTSTSPFEGFIVNTQKSIPIFYQNVLLLVTWSLLHNINTYIQWKSTHNAKGFFYNTKSLTVSLSPHTATDYQTELNLLAKKDNNPRPKIGNCFSFPIGCVLSVSLLTF